MAPRLSAKQRASVAWIVQKAHKNKVPADLQDPYYRDYEVLGCFKQLHRTRLTVFQGDDRALTAARDRINMEFVKNKEICDASSVEELVKYGHEVEEVLRTSVVQAVQKEDGLFSARIRPEVMRLDNKPYSPMPESMIGPFKKKKTECSDT